MKQRSHSPRAIRRRIERSYHETSPQCCETCKHCEEDCEGCRSCELWITYGFPDVVSPLGLCSEYEARP